MKKLLLAAFLGASLYGYSQDNYFSVSVGYGLGLPGETAVESESDTNFTGTFRTKQVSFGGGINAQISYGIPVSENVHIDLALGYQNNLGSKREDVDYGINFDPNFNPIYEKNTTVTTYKTSSFRLAPTLRFMGEGEVRPFAQVGPQFILASMKEVMELEAGSNTALSEEKYNMRFSVGATAAVGVEFAMADDLMFFTALNASLGFYSPTKSEVVTMEINGQDMLGQLDTREKETEYVKEIEMGGSGTGQDEPRQDLKSRYDYSAVGLKAGVRLIL